MTGLVDTSVIVGAEAGRIHPGELPEHAYVSSITIGELHLGVLAADEPESRGRRVETLAYAERTFISIPVDDEVARAFARLVDGARRAGRRPPVLDALIAATAASRSLTLYTQDTDFHAFPEVDIRRL